MRESLSAPIAAAEGVMRDHGLVLDRRDILQDGHTLVVRLSDTVVARIVNDPDGPRKGSEWFERETAIAGHLTRMGAPVVPMHPGIPPVAHLRNGFAMNFWEFVTTVDDEPGAEDIGRTLADCHAVLRSFHDPLPVLGIVHESLSLLDTLEAQGKFPASTLSLLRHHLIESIRVLDRFPHQALHGDAHAGNLMMTTQGLLWADWEDAFAGPVEWDLASIIWNARLLDNDEAMAAGILLAYQSAGGSFDEVVLQQSLIARAAVMSAWYPVLYPQPSAERQAKLDFRLNWLAGLA